jgi:iron complex outermembrane receptor protein
MVYGASKYEQNISRAPASVSIVTANEIRKFGYRTLADVLRNTAGLYVTNDRNYSFVGIRGFSQPGDFNTGILLLIDGHRVNDATYNLIYVAQEALLDVEAIDRVEIIRGPSSSIYGNSAFFGVINIITRHGQDIDGAEFSAQAGDLDTYRAAFNFGKKYADGLDLTLSASFYDSAGKSRIFYPELADADHNDGYAIDSDDETAYRLFSSVRFRDFTLSGAYSHRYKKVPAAPSGTAFNSGKGETNDDRGFVDLRYERELTPTRRVLGRVSYDWYPYRAVYPYENDAPPPALILNRDESRGRWARAELQLTQRLLERHTLIVGMDYQDNLQLHQLNYDEDPFVSYLNIDHGGQSYALYTQGEFELARPLLLNAGLRYDHFSTFGSTTNPRLGLIYSPQERMALKMLYGEAFRAPNDYELNYESATFQRNPSLGPETIRTYELVYEQSLPGSLRMSAAAYHYKIDDLIAETTDPLTGLNSFRNIDQVGASGVELQIEGHISNATELRASYALQRAKDEATGARLTNSPRHLGKLNLSVPLYQRKLFASLGLQYQGAVVAPAGTAVDDFVLASFTLFEQWRANGPTLSASIYNLFDTQYSTAASGNTLQGSLPENGRTFSIGLTWPLFKSAR